MGLPRSTFYDAPSVAVDDSEVVRRMRTICDEFETYGYRRVGAALRQDGMVVNSKKVRRLMREHDLQPQPRRRFVATTDGNHELPVFPNLASNIVPDGPNQLWNGDITYVAVASRFVYVAPIVDALSRRVVGYAIARSIDARLAVAALEAAIALRRPPRGCICHTDRGSQYASARYRELLAHHGLVGSMSQRGNPFDNSKAERLHQDPRGRGRIPGGLRDVRGRRHRPVRVYDTRRLHSTLRYLSPYNSRTNIRPDLSRPCPGRCPPAGAHSNKWESTVAINSHGTPKAAAVSVTLC